MLVLFVYTIFSTDRKVVTTNTIHFVHADLISYFISIIVALGIIAFRCYLCADTIPGEWACWFSARGVFVIKLIPLFVNSRIRKLLIINVGAIAHCLVNKLHNASAC